jgi:hypothetical protein
LQYSQSLTFASGCHKNCSTVNKRSIKLVSLDVWSALLDIFPNAIEHSLDPIEGVDLNVQLGTMVCNSCQIEEEVSGVALQRALELVQKCHLMEQKSPCLSGLEAQQIYDKVIQKDHDAHHFFIVHKSEVQAWRNFILLMRKKDVKKSGFSLDNAVYDILLPTLNNRKSSSVLDDSLSLDFGYAERIAAMLTHFVKPLICSEHKRPIRSVLLSGTKSLLLDDICVFSAASLEEYLTHVAALFVIVLSSTKGSLENDLESILRESRSIIKHTEMLSYYPSFHQSSPSSSPEVFHVSSDFGSVLFRFSKHLCQDDHCQETYTSRYSNICSNSCDPKSTINGVSTLNHQEVIVVDSDTDDIATLQAFDVASLSDLTTGKSKLLLRVYEVVTDCH